MMQLTLMHIETSWGLGLGFWVENLAEYYISTMPHLYAAHKHSRAHANAVWWAELYICIKKHLREAEKAQNPAPYDAEQGA